MLRVGLRLTLRVGLRRTLRLGVRLTLRVVKRPIRKATRCNAATHLEEPQLALHVADISLILESPPQLSSRLIPELTGANRVIDSAPGACPLRNRSPLAVGSPGGPYSLALLAHFGASGRPVVDRSKFFPRFLRHTLLGIRDLGGARASCPNPSPAILVRSGHIAGGSGRTHCRPVRGRTVS